MKRRPWGFDPLVENNLMLRRDRFRFRFVQGSSYFPGQNSYPTSHLRCSALPDIYIYIYIHTPTKWQVLSVAGDLDSRVMYTRGRGTSKDQIIVLGMGISRMWHQVQRRHETAFWNLSPFFPFFFSLSSRHSRPAFLSRWQVFRPRTSFPFSSLCLFSNIRYACTRNPSPQKRKFSCCAKREAIVIVIRV